MTAPPSSEVVDAAIFLVLLVALIARRTYRMVQGTRYSTGRLFGFTGFYVFLFALLAFATLYAAVAAWGTLGWALLAPYVAVPAAAALLAVPYVRRIVRFEQRVDGAWWYQLPWLIPVLTLALFVVRFVLELAIFGLAYVTSFFLPTSIPTGLLLVLVSIDLLFGFSVGLLVGRSVGVFRAFRAMRTTPAAKPLPRDPAT